MMTGPESADKAALASEAGPTSWSDTLEIHC